MEFGGGEGEDSGCESIIAAADANNSLGVSMIEHEPWVGPHFASGLDGKRVGIVGYSHFYEKDEEDSEDCTLQVLRNVINGSQRGDSFFPPIPGYFGYADKATFWNRVLFFNFLPDCIGLAEKKYGFGSATQTKNGRERFLHILQREKPDKVFVFTKKGWDALQEEASKACTPLGTDFPTFSWRVYADGGYSVMAFGLRHPERANGRQMRLAVQECLSSRFEIK